MTSGPAFFKEALIYQIYPASFCDSNGDGFGDLKGIRSKLDYLQSFGVDVIWLSPIYKSPLKDMGYDIADYRAIDPRYGSLEDWDELVADLHKRGMKIMMDLVVNHTSDEHEWFIESRSSRAHPKRDWYIWRPPKYSSSGERLPPNNWASHFGGSAWEWDEVTQEYYLHLYVPGQPDLNWENIEVREAVWDMMLWWLKRGTDGFRMDVINMISKVSGLPDGDILEPEAKYQKAWEHYINGPRVHEFIQEMNRKVLSQFPDCLTVGETPCTHEAKEVIKYIQPHRKELQMVFQFELNDIDRHTLSPLIPVRFTLPTFKSVVNKWQRYMYEHDGWNALYMENHDTARSVSRFLNIHDPKDPLRARAAKLLAILHTTQGGTLYVYQGQELGLGNIPPHWGMEEYKDIATQNFYNEMLEERIVRTGSPNPDMSDIASGINNLARDNCRTPMHWSSVANAGFTTPNAVPWMRINEDYQSWNAELQINDPESVWSFWKKAIQIRKSHQVMTYGDFTLLSPEDEKVFVYTRKQGDAVALVILNFSRDEATYSGSVLNLSGFETEVRLRLTNIGGNANDSLKLSKINVKLAPFEGRIYMV